jgi:cysteine synthase A
MQVRDRQCKPGLKIIAVEPEESPVLSGGAPGPHGIQGIGAGFVPGVLDLGVVDEVVKVNSQTAIATARELAGSKAFRSAYPRACAPAPPGRKTIVIIVPSFAGRYLSTALFEGL